MFNLGRIGQQLKTIFTPSNKAEKEQLTKTEGRLPNGTHVSPDLKSVEGSVKKIEVARNNPTRLEKNAQGKLVISIHRQPDNVKKSDNKLKAKAKAFFQKLGLLKSNKTQASAETREPSTTKAQASVETREPSTPKEKLESLVAQKKYDEAATLVINSEHKEARTLLEALTGLESNEKELLFNAIAEKAKHPETKEQTLRLVRHVFNHEIKEHHKRYPNDPGSIFRSDTSGSKLLSSFYETLVPKSAQEEIRSIANQQPHTENLITLGEKGKTVSEKNQGIVRDKSQQARDRILEVAKSLPDELKQINQSLSEAITKTYGSEVAEKQTVAVFFLRFANPTLFKEAAKQPPNTAPEQEKVEAKNKQQNIILVNKMLQNFASGVKFEKKEPHLSFMDDFVTNTEAKQQFLEALLPK